MTREKLTVVLATRNSGKVAELEEILAAVRPELEVKGLDSYPDLGEIPETGSTFEENALIKARAVARHTGHIAVADDSGLVVPALDNEPGVYSARYAGEKASDLENNQKLLKRMNHLSGDSRQARFVCVLCACTPREETLVVQGEWPGVILDEPRGQGGFGYDPLFFDPQAGLTAAEMEAEQKNSRSHRGRALQSLMHQWEEFMTRINKQGA